MPSTKPPSVRFGRISLTNMANTPANAASTIERSQIQLYFAVRSNIQPPIETPIAAPSECPPKSRPSVRPKIRTPRCVATIFAITGKVAKFRVPNITANINIKPISASMNNNSTKVIARKKNMLASRRGRCT